jgi:AcrR family transcriptional regulator
MQPPTQPSPTSPTRQRILDAADHLMRTLGLARTTTKEIARGAGCSEAALYKHFAGKEDLFVAVLQERLPPLGPLLTQLVVESGADGGTPGANAIPGADATARADATTTGPTSGDAATGGVEARLVAIATQAALFYEQSMPIASSLFADPALLQRHRDALRKIGAGPHLPLEALARYLRLERDHGRIAAHADPDAAAALLLGACYQRAFLRHFMGIEDGPTVDEFARATARTLIGGIG